MTEPDINATIAKLRAETERLDLENRKRSAEMTRDLLESMHRQRSVLRKPNALTEWFPTLLTGVMVLGFLAALVFVVIAARREHYRWETFAKTHDCRVVEKMAGDVDTTVAPIFDGKGGVSYAVGVTDTPGKTAYLCNDGVKYWR